MQTRYSQDPSINPVEKAMERFKSKPMTIEDFYGASSLMNQPPAKKHVHILEDYSERYS